MTPSFPEIINSRLFKFIVGETIDGIPTEFLVHEEAIAQLSKPLHGLVKGSLSEAQAGCTIWKEVSKETFERFVQVAYTGDYSIPNPRESNQVAEPEMVVTDTLVHRAPLRISEELETEPDQEKPADDSLDELQWSMRRSKKVKKDNEKGEETGEGFVGWNRWFQGPWHTHSLSFSQSQVQSLEQVETIPVATVTAVTEAIRN